MAGKFFTISIDNSEFKRYYIIEQCLTHEQRLKYDRVKGGEELGTKERQERERDQMRELILNTANNIIATDGFEGLSIRKIAGRIEYSPAIVYHYFKDKDDIVHQLMKRGYKKIIDAISPTSTSAHDPAQKLRDMTRNYIEAALNMPDEFKAVQLNTAPEIVEFTASLFKGASLKKPALAILCQCLKEVYRDQDIDDSFIEMTAQVIATSTFGLIIRLILEKNIISGEQREKLINHYIKLTVDGLVLGKGPGQLTKGADHNAQSCPYHN